MLNRQQLGRQMKQERKQNEEQAKLNAHEALQKARYNRHELVDSVANNLRHKTAQLALQKQQQAEQIYRDKLVREEREKARFEQEIEKMRLEEEIMLTRVQKAQARQSTAATASSAVSCLD
eukprot:CAMPEP_0173114508 /NCGR_PEP_ID=MMETSP1102-20130122/47701_1 /TAXON_ID=49646 /ORGANISM="Geminigera sp., Strain Caron Lab Isolate" /LENGTH=120 /DNA_ID=CAMNT_0014016875 /DNA_START=30 /DNA_END=388 /DNA_ORIENTATION=-